MTEFQKWMRCGAACAAVLAAALLTGGCRSTAEEKAADANVTPVMRQRSEALASMWAKDRERAVLFRDTDLAFYSKSLPQLTARLALLKVNRVFWEISSEDTLLSGGGRRELLEMIEALGTQGVRCDLVLPQSSFPESRSANALGRLFSSSRPFEDALDCALSLKDRLPEETPAVGVTVWAGLHRMTASNKNMPAGAMYRWNEKNYGKGSDNDMMMNQFFASLAQWRAKAAAAGVRFSVAIPSLYHEKAAAGELSKGTVKDFLETADQVLVLGYGDRPSVYLQSLRGALQDSKGRVLCGMVLSGHVSDRAGAIRRRSWNDFFRIVKAIHGACLRMPGFDGMALIPWQSVELLQEK